MAVPEEIKACCPDEFGAVEIQKRGDRFHVYRVTSGWSKDKGKPKKVTGGCVGMMVPGDGIAPDKNGMIFRDKHKAPLPDARPHVRGYGAYETIRQLSLGLDERLKEYFPDLFREVKDRGSPPSHRRRVVRQGREAGVPLPRVFPTSPPTS